MKKYLFVPSMLGLFLIGANLAFAHAVVKPSQAGVGAFQVFTLGVPSEKPVATTGVRLTLPDGLNFVTPNVKAGWKVEVKTQATGKQVQDDDGMMVDEMKPVEIDWTGGSIPSGQRDEFAFQAQVPSAQTTLNWKVYQTFSDGSVMSWDHDPSAPQPKDAKGNNDFSKVGPYSVTNVVNDFSATTTPTASSSAGSIQIVEIVSALALVIALWSVFRQNRTI